MQPCPKSRDSLTSKRFQQGFSEMISNMAEINLYFVLRLCMN